jgi:hypothetical protein
MAVFVLDHLVQLLPQIVEHTVVQIESVNLLDHLNHARVVVLDRGGSALVHHTFDVRVYHCGSQLVRPFCKQPCFLISLFNVLLYDIKAFLVFNRRFDWYRFAVTFIECLCPQAGHCRLRL